MTQYSSTHKNDVLLICYYLVNPFKTLVVGAFTYVTVKNNIRLHNKDLEIEKKMDVGCVFGEILYSYVNAISINIFSRYLHSRKIREKNVHIT